jgi:antitoxin VapB
MQHRAKLFTNGGSQAVRLPKKFNLPKESEVLVHKCGNKIILEPINYSWGPLLKGLELLNSDFNFEREDPDYSYKDLF